MSSMAGNNAEAGRSVASKIFAVLDAFTGVEGTLRLTDIVERTGLPMPTALRMTRELLAWGGLERHSDGSYRIGGHMWAVGNLSPCMRLQQELARPHLQELASRTGGNAQLAIREGTHALFLDRVSAPGALPIHTHPGGRLPLYATAVGKVLLAHASAPVMREVVSRGFTRYTKYTIDSAARLARDLDRVRADGIAHVHEELQLGAVSVAAPVLHPDLGVIAAIGVVAAATTPLARIEPAVRTAGRRLSAATVEVATRQRHDLTDRDLAPRQISSLLPPRL
jgi:IclR family acetate operon transcriptional repressor